MLWLMALAYTLVVLALQHSELEAFPGQAVAVLKRLSMLGRCLTVGKLAEAISLDFSKDNVASLRGLLVFSGLGIKKGERLQGTVGLVDIVPTISYLTGLPLPANAEGAVIYQALEDPNFKAHRIEELTDSLAKMEAALSGKQE
ncbi:MAG: hypothetical protein M0Z94_20610 [Dehalococcoidales bacterium]|nr:hypothetical protein [Dehalococcoidales bacterium]